MAVGSDNSLRTDALASRRRDDLERPRRPTVASLPDRVMLPYLLLQRIVFGDAASFIFRNHFKGNGFTNCCPDFPW